MVYSGSEDILQTWLWKKHFENLFNCLRDNVNYVNCDIEYSEVNYVNCDIEYSDICM